MITEMTQGLGTVSSDEQMLRGGSVLGEEGSRLKLNQLILLLKGYISFNSLPPREVTAATMDL